MDNRTFLLSIGASTPELETPVAGARVREHSGSIAHGVFLIEKRDDAGYLVEVVEFPNEYVNAGAQQWLDLLIGAGGTPFNAANAAIGVGDSSASVVVTQTDLQSSANKTRKGMDASYPSRTAQVATWKATFGPTEANFAWNEVGLFNAAVGGAMLCRKVQSLGTKNGGTWTVLYTITVP